MNLMDIYQPPPHFVGLPLNGIQGESLTPQIKFVILKISVLLFLKLDKKTMCIKANAWSFLTEY